MAICLSTYKTYIIIIRNMNIMSTFDSKYINVSTYLLYFITLIQLLNIIYIVLLSAFGITAFDNAIISDINSSIRIIVCIILMVKFNPFRTTHVFHKNDASIIFGSSAFLLFNLGIMEYITYYLDKINKNIAS